MATERIKDLLDQFDAFKKLAGERESENITGQDPDSMPGSENDKPIPEGATKDDPKVKDETINNTDARNLDGAKPGSDAPVVEQGLESSEAVLNPDKKPLDTADANAKEASALGKSLLDTILKTKEAAAKKEAEKAAEKKAEEPAEKKAEEQKKEDKPAEKKAAPSEKISVDMSMLAKIAAITLADEEGQLAVQAALTKRAGAEFAAEVLDIIEKRAQEQAAFEKGAQDAEAMIGDLQEAQGAADAEAALGDQASAEGDPAAAAVDDAAAAGDEGAAAGDELSLDDFSPEEVAEAVQEMAQEGQISPEDAQAVVEAVQGQAAETGEADDLSEEELAGALEEAISNGQLTDEDVQEIVQALSEGGADEGAVQQLAGDVGDGAAAGGGEPAAEGGEPPAGEPAAEEGEKAASAKDELKTKLLAAIKTASAKKAPKKK